jgi:exopolyphosphatase/guanosine-5'-triphosphate,3'-diphosphate pyrophosphatase
VLAAVDVGTNTVRMLLGEVSAGRVEPFRYYRRITRLGGGATQRDGLSPVAMERTLSALREAAQLIREAGVTSVRVVGTEALRCTVNGPAFAARVRAETGLPLEVVPGEEEARLSAAGVLAALDPRPRRCLIFDLGGGSTEFILFGGDALLFHRSYPLGVVALSERFPSAAGWRRQIHKVLGVLTDDLAEAGLGSAAPADCLLVGTAGTVTTRAALVLERAEYDWRRVNNLALNRRALFGLQQRLQRLGVAEREALPGMEKGRGDLIVPGLQLVLSVMALFGKESLTVSDFGLLEGLLLNLAQRERAGIGSD